MFPKYKFADPLPPIKNEVVLVNEQAVDVVAPLAVTVANVSVSVYEVIYPAPFVNWLLFVGIVVLLKALAPKA